MARLVISGVVVKLRVTRYSEPQRQIVIRNTEDCASCATQSKVFRVLNENLRLCLICDEVFTRQGAAEHAHVACYPRTKESEEDEGTLDPCSPCHLGKAGEILPDILDGN
jgi:hypothetical protein